MSKVCIKADSFEGQFIGVSNPNLFINGDGQLNQRGSKMVSNGLYPADRWLLTGTSARVLSSTTITFPNTKQKNVFEIHHAPNTSDLDLKQRVEGLKHFDGGVQITVSCMMRVAESFGNNPANVPSDFINGLRWRLATGVNGVETFYGNINITEVTSIIPNEWFKVSGTAFISKLPEYDITKDYNNYFQVGIAVNADTNATTNAWTLHATDFKLEFGHVATPFVPDDPATNLAKCQRYYERILCMFDGQQPKGGSNGSSTIRFTPKRIMVNGKELHRELSGNLLVVQPFLESYGFTGFPGAYGYRYRIQFSPDSNVDRTGGVHTLFEIDAEL